jgi:hypothetical protein
MRFALVDDAGNCIGFVLRSRHQYQAFDGDEKTLGLFDTEEGAVTAIVQTLPTNPTPKENLK